jgi:cholesterol 7-dehydrogenase
MAHVFSAHFMDGPMMAKLVPVLVFPLIMSDHNKKPLRGISAEYDESIGSRDSKVVFHKCETDIKLRKYPVRELNHLVHVWIHSDPKREPEYDLLNVEWLQQELSYRGVAENRIHCHIQDIAENGADIMHFYYVHKYLVSAWKWFYVNWLASWVRLDSEDIKGKFTHTLKNVDEFKKRIYENMVKGNKDGKYIGSVNVDAYINLPFLKEFFGWNITVFQVGSGVVYIIVKSYFFTALYIQFIQTEGKFTQHAYH